MGRGPLRQLGGKPARLLISSPGLRSWEASAIGSSNSPALPSCALMPGTAAVGVGHARLLDLVVTEVRLQSRPSGSERHLGRVHAGGVAAMGTPLRHVGQKA